MKPDVKTCFRVGLSIFVLYLCIHYWDAVAGILQTMVTAAAPLLTGCLIAYVTNIPMSFYERHYFPRSSKPLAVRSRRPVCMLLAFASIAAVVFLVLRIVVPEVGKCVALLLSAVPPMLQDVTEALSKSPMLSENIANYLEGLDWESILTNAFNFLKTGVGAVTDWAVRFMTTLVSGLADFFIALIFAVYLLGGKERLGRQLGALTGRYLRQSWRDGGNHVLKTADNCFHHYIVGQCTEAVILGVLCAVGMLIFGFPYAAVVGATVGLMALIPIAGAYIGGAVGFLLILTVSPIKAVLFVVYLVILQQLEGNIIYPKVVGTSLGLPGIWVLAAVIVGGGLGGIAGMILGVPLTACVYRLVKEDVQRGRKAADGPLETVPKTE